MRTYKVRMEVVTNGDLYTMDGRVIQRFIFMNEEKAKEVFDLLTKAIEDREGRVNDCGKVVTFSDDTGSFTIPPKNLVSVRTVNNDAWSDFHRECVLSDAAVEAEAKAITG